jgi:ankyrin repeat protein
MEQELLNHDANVNTENTGDFTAPHVAGGNGHVEVVRDLRNHGINLITAAKDVITPLHAARQKGHVEVVRELLNHSDQVNKLKEAGQKFINQANRTDYLNLICDVLK